MSLNQAVLEQYVLSCMLQDNKLVKQPQNVFVSEISKTIFRSIKLLYNTDRQINVANLYLEVANSDSSVTKEKIEGLFNVEIDLNEFDNYFSQLKKVYLKEELRTGIIKDLVVAVDSKQDDFDYEAIQESLLQGYRQVRNIINPTSKLKTLPTLFDNFEQTLKNRLTGESNLSTGSQVLDSALGNGLSTGEITLIFGRTSIGKSAFAMSLLSKMINLRIPVLYFTLEMSETASFQRLISERTSMPYLEFNNHTMDHDVYEMQSTIIKREKEFLQDINTFRLIDHPHISLEDIRYFVREFKEDTGHNNIVVLVDLLKMVSDFKKLHTEHTSIEYAMDDASALVKDENIALIGVHQANRATDSDKKIADEEKIETFRPQLAHLKGSGSLEERARVILGLHRPYYYYERYFPELLELQENIMEVQILKNSNGESGKRIKYLYQPQVMRFTSYIDPEESNEDIENNV